MPHRLRQTPEPPNPLRLEHQLCFATHAAALALQKVYRPLLRPLGLTYPQYLALLVLWEEPEVTLGELGRRLLLDSGTLTPLVKRLEQAGWVMRRRDEADERRLLVSLTPAGRRLRDKARDIPACMLQTCGLQAQEAQRLKQRMDSLRQQLLLSLTESTNPAPRSRKGTP